MPNVSNLRLSTPSGGLAEEVDVDILKAAFIPFGDIKDVQIPPDPQNSGRGG